MSTVGPRRWQREAMHDSTKDPGDLWTWDQIRSWVGGVQPLGQITLPLAAAGGAMLAQPLTARTDLPPHECASDSGWAVSGIGPWRLVAGDAAAALPDGDARPVAAGGAIPEGCSAVLPRSGGVSRRVAGGELLFVAGADGEPGPHPGQVRLGSGIAARGTHAGAGQILLKAGALVTPSVAALAAAAGQDDLAVLPPPTVTAVLPHYALARRGPVRLGRPRDVVADLVAGWLETSTARHGPIAEIPADSAELAQFFAGDCSDIVVVSGGVDSGVPAVVQRAAELSGAVRMAAGLEISPGAGTQLWAMPDQRFLLLLPGGVADAAAAMASMFDPLVAAMAGTSGGGQAAPVEALAATGPPAGLGEVGEAAPGQHLLVPVILERGEVAFRAHAVGWAGPSGAQGLAAADGLAVFPPGRRSGLVEVLPLPGVLLA